MRAFAGEPHHMSTNESVHLAPERDIDQSMLLQAALAQLKQLTDRVVALEASQANAQARTVVHTSSPARGRDPFMHRQTGWQPTR